MMQIRVTGLKETRSFIARLPKSVNEEVGQKGILELARNLQKRIKYRAPVDTVDTGWLRRSVMVEKTRKGAMVAVYAYYALAIEKGSTPRVIPYAYFEQHKRIPEAPGEYVRNARRWVHLTGRPQPFVEPALKSLRPDIPKILRRYIKSAINKARKGGR